MTDWYSWSSAASFELWHTQVCAALGLPRAPVNMGTGIVNTDAQWTTAYTAAVDCGTDWRAVVEPDIATAYPTGLGTPCDPPPTPDPDI